VQTRVHAAAMMRAPPAGAQAVQEQAAELLRARAAAREDAAAAAALRRQARARASRTCGAVRPALKLLSAQPSMVFALELHLLSLLTRCPVREAGQSDDISPISAWRLRAAQVGEEAAAAAALLEQAAAATAELGGRVAELQALRRSLPGDEADLRGASAAPHDL